MIEILRYACMCVGSGLTIYYVSCLATRIILDKQ